MPRNFVEQGAASSILALNEYAGVPLAQDQSQVTPFQRMVVQLEAQRQKEEAEEEHSRGGGPQNPTMNSKAMPSSNKPIQGETVTYVNEGA